MSIKGILTQEKIKGVLSQEKITSVLSDEDLRYYYLSRGNRHAVFILWCIQNIDNSLTQYMAERLIESGDSMTFLLSYSVNYTEEQISLINSYIANGLDAAMAYHRGMSSFVFQEGEQTEFADEITNGDLIEVTAPAGGDACYVNITFNDYTTGELVSSTKQNGSLIIDDTDLWSSLDGVYFIPPGESGVPVEIEGKPLWIDGSGNLRYYEWDAGDFFSVNFSNTDSISLYRLDSDEYIFSEDGLKCFFKHLRNRIENQGITKLAGFWENTGEGARPRPAVSSPAAIAAGMEFGSNGTAISGFQDLQGRSDDPTQWCGNFAHHSGFHQISDPIADRIEDICKAYVLQYIIQSENEWTQDEFDTIYAKMKMLGIKFMSPAYFIELYENYPSDSDLQNNVFPRLIDNNSDDIPDGFTIADADLDVDFNNNKFTVTKNTGHIVLQCLLSNLYKGVNTITFNASNNGSGIDRLRLKVDQNGGGNVLLQNYYITGDNSYNIELDLSAYASVYSTLGCFVVQLYIYYINSNGLEISNFEIRKS